MIGAIPAFVLWLPFAWRVLSKSDAEDLRTLMYLSLWVVFTLQAVMLLSLYLKRGSVLIAIGVLWAGGGAAHALLEQVARQIVGWYSTRTFMQWVVRIEVAAMIGLILAFQPWIVRRVRKVAAK